MNVTTAAHRGLCGVCNRPYAAGDRVVAASKGNVHAACQTRALSLVQKRPKGLRF